MGFKRFSRHWDGYFSLLRIILNSLHKHSCSLGVDCFSISLLILSNPELVLFFRVFIAACMYLTHLYLMIWHISATGGLGGGGGGGGVGGGVRIDVNEEFVKIPKKYIFFFLGGGGGGGSG